MRKTLSIIPVIFIAMSLPEIALAADEPNVLIPDSIRGAVTTSTEGLVEESALSGTVVRLGGRFQSVTTATVDETGRLVLKCHTPGSGLGSSLPGHDHPVND